MSAPPDLGSLYDAHASALFAFLLNFTRSEEDTRDLLQEVFVKVARQPGRLKDVREERAFLLRMARNAALDLVRRRRSQEHTRAALAEEPVTLFVATSDPDETSFGMALSSALATLPVEQREIVFLKLWEGLTFDEIARLLEIPLNTAASRYRYGVDKLREQLRPLYDEIK